LENNLQNPATTVVEECCSWHGDGDGLRNASIIKQIRVAQTSKGIDMFGMSVNIERARSIYDETPFQIQNESCE
jgi:hypothetical protein